MGAIVSSRDGAPSAGPRSLTNRNEGRHVMAIASYFTNIQHYWPAGAFRK
jgi:hypothetical protein